MIRFAALLFAAIWLSAQTATVRVDMAPGREINSFDPDRALGSSIDVLSKTGIDKVYTPHIVQEALSAGWGPITYRNNTELRMAAWHWTENGRWSDDARKSGYFTGDSDPKEPVRYILSYALPHRGFSASGDRPVTGPNQSYWKSNPYLTSRFTGESDTLHPQWVVLDLRAARPVDSVEIAWANPYARNYQVEYWVGTNPLSRAPNGEWRPFPSGKVRNGSAGTAKLKLAVEPVSTRYLRIWMTESSNTCDLHGDSDVRNCVGYAIQDFKVAGQDANASYVTSSIDPWHSAADVNATGTGQHSGFDVFYRSGLTNNLPAMIPVTMLYGTPEDSAAQIAYIQKRGYPIGWIEMGEEPDGKHMLPEDYGALYLQWATALHKVNPALKLGGPVFEGINEDIKVWPDAQGRTSWIGRFIEYLKSHGRLGDLAFVSLEHYPFEPCGITWKSLYREPQMMKHVLDSLRQAGVPKEIPIMVTESHISWRLTGPMSTIFAALWLADNVGSFFEGGGAAFYHSPIQPQPVQDTCLGPATWSNFVADREYNISGYTSPYWAARMINLEWVQHRSGTHRMFPSTTGIEDVTSYAVLRPDGNWSLMLVNRSETESHPVQVAFDDGNSSRAFAGPVTMVTFGSEQYVWKPDGAKSYADPDGPPAAKAMPGGTGASFTLPKASVTVLRGKIAPAVQVQQTGMVGRRVENPYFIADLSAVAAGGREQDSGTLRALTFKEFGVTLFRSPANGRMHKGQSVQRAGARSYEDLGNWMPVQTFREDNQNGTYIHRREGYFPSYPEVKMEAEYRFPPDAPYFIVSTVMTVEKPLRVVLLRNNEMTMNLFFTHLAWPGRDGTPHVVAFDERRPVIERDPISARVPWLAFVNLEKGYGYGFITLDYKASKTANEDTTISDGFLSGAELAAARAKAAGDGKSLAEPVINARYWSRHIISGREMDLLPGDRFEERTAYVLFHCTKEEPVRELLDWEKRIRDGN